MDSQGTFEGRRGHVPGGLRLTAIQRIRSGRTASHLLIPDGMEAKMSRILIATITAATGLSLLTGCDLIVKATPTQTAAAPTSPSSPEPTAGSQAPGTSAPTPG